MNGVQGALSLGLVPPIDPFTGKPKRRSVNMQQYIQQYSAQLREQSSKVAAEKTAAETKAAELKAAEQINLKRKAEASAKAAVTDNLEKPGSQSPLPKRVRLSPMDLASQPACAVPTSSMSSQSPTPTSLQLWPQCPGIPLSNLFPDTPLRFQGFLESEAYHTLLPCWLPPAGPYGVPSFDKEYEPFVQSVWRAFMDTKMVLDLEDPDTKAARFQVGGIWAHDIADTEAVSWQIVQAAVSLHMIGVTGISYKRGLAQLPRAQSPDGRLTFSQRVFLLELAVRFYKGVAHHFMMQKDLEQYVLYPSHLLMENCGFRQAMGRMNAETREMINFQLGKRGLPSRFMNPDGSFNAKALADEKLRAHAQQSPLSATLSPMKLSVSPFSLDMVSGQAQASSKSPSLPPARLNPCNFLRKHPASSTIPVTRQVPPEDEMAILKSVMDESLDTGSGPKPSDPVNNNGDAELVDFSAYVHGSDGDWVDLTQVSSNNMSTE